MSYNLPQGKVMMLSSQSSIVAKHIQRKHYVEPAEVDDA
jgi:hypothetical protein